MMEKTSKTTFLRGLSLLRTLELAATAYVLAALAVSIVLTREPFQAAAAVVLVLQGVVLVPRVGAGVKLCVTLAAFALLPVILAPVLGTMLSAVASIPVLLLVNGGLRDYSGGNGIDAGTAAAVKPGIRVTPMTKAIITATFSVLLLSVFLSVDSLIMASLFLAMDISLLSLYVIRKIPPCPLECSRERRRVLAGESLSVKAEIKSDASLPVRVKLSPSQKWMSIDGDSMIMNVDPGVEPLAVNMTPPLAAPSRTTLSSCTVDPWGLLSFSQELDPVELHVIPRARYATWLAKKYLEQTAPGYFPSMATPPLRKANATRRGVEYYGSRLYQPGDSVKDVDWRQTFRLQELVVKEFAGGQAQPVVIAVDLTAGDAEDADRLAYDLITSALTMAKQSVPIAIAAYDNEGVVETTGVINPREALKKAMLLSGRISIEPAPERVIGPVDPLRLGRNISLLRWGFGYDERERSEGGEKLEQVLDMEYKSVNASAAQMPVTLALKKVVDRIPPPAAVVVVASQTGDENALRVNIKSLSEKGYRTIAPASVKREVEAMAR